MCALPRAPSAAARTSFSELEIGLPRETWNEFGSVEKWDLVDLLHGTLPEDPNGSMLPIRPEDILRALGRTDAEIRQIEADSEAEVIAGLLRRV